MQYFCRTMLIGKATETRIATVETDELGVIITTMKDCGLVDEFDVVDLNLVVRHMAEGIPRLKLLIATADFDMSKKARDMVKKEDHLSQTRARAIVVNGRLRASVSNFFDQFRDRPYPQQFFRDRQEAYEWLVGLKF